MKVLVDINIFMDVLTRRSGWSRSLATIEALKPRGIAGVVSALTISVVYFLRLPFVGELRARSEARTIITDEFEVVPLTRRILDNAFDSHLPDFEDNIQFYTAKEATIDYLITRNKKHFKQDEIPVVTPDEFLKIIAILK